MDDQTDNIKHLTIVTEQKKGLPTIKYANNSSDVQQKQAKVTKPQKPSDPAKKIPVSYGQETPKREGEVLVALTKSRARGVAGRQPPSRQARKEALKANGKI